jgi:glycosidase
LGVFNSGPAWEWNEKRQQYYYHAFQVKQPDLNYRNPMVVEEIKVITVGIENTGTTVSLHGVTNVNG